MPTSETMARIIESYADNYLGRPQHSFLLNSKSNVPLSTEALTKAISVISNKLPVHVVRELESRTGKTTVTPHDLRHTCAVVRPHQLLQHGDSMDEALEEAGIVRHLDEIVTRLRTGEQVPYPAVADAGMVLCAYQFAMRPVQIGILDARHVRIWRDEIDDDPTVHLTFHMAKQRGNKRSNSDDLASRLTPCCWSDGRIQPMGHCFLRSIKTCSEN